MDTDSAASTSTRPFWRRANAIFPIALCVLSTATLLVSMVLFHTLAELFAVGIAVMSFVVAWNTYALSRNQFLLLVGSAYLWVGILDLLHTLSFTGLNLLPAPHGGITISFWVAARLLEASIFLFGALSFRHTLRIKCIFTGLGLFSVVVSALIFLDYAPRLYVEGKGLTPLKIWLEYLTIALLATAAIMLYPHRQKMSATSFRFIMASIGLTILAELNFTLYHSLSDLPVVIGHLLKLISFWLIYLVLIDASLLGPVRQLERIVDTFDAVVDEAVVIDRSGLILQANKALRERCGETLLGQHCHEFLHDGSPIDDCFLCKAISRRQTIQGYQFYREASDTWVEVSLSGITLSDNYVTMIQHNRDITKRKKTEQELHTLNKLYTMRSQANQAIAATKSQDELLQRMTQIAVKYGEFRMAWIGLIQGTKVVPTYIAGEDQGYLQHVQMRTDDSKWARGPVGLAARSATVQWVNNVLTDPDFEPWREAALQRGYRSLAAVPLLSDGEVTGIFTLYSGQEGVFSEAMITLLTHLSKDLQLAIYHFKQRAKQQRAEIEIRKLSLAVEQSANAILIVGVTGKVEYINEGFTALTGYSRDDVFTAKNPFIDLQIWDAHSIEMIWDLVREGKVWRGELATRRKDGRQIWALQTVSPIKDSQGTITHYVATGTDNSELHEAKEIIEELAFYDPLTHLANRRLLTDRMKAAIDHMGRKGGMFAVLLFDLDDFKQINDNWGHEAGDALLIHIARVLKDSIRDTDTAARMGGDEFVLLLENVHAKQEVSTTATHILKKLDEHSIALAGHEVRASTSIGISLYPQDGDTPSELLRKADLAMYEAKRQGKNALRFYTPKDAKA